MYTHLVGGTPPSAQQSWRDFAPRPPDTLQATCDEVQDAAGRPRFVVRGEHAAYLEDDDAGEDFFAGAGALSRFGTGAEESAEDIARKRETAMAGGGGWLSWLKW